jgi:D-xylose 1-dehydrogenase (NADP+, D-xylono-1,5-lactone-forming)
MQPGRRLRWGILSTARINDEVIPQIRQSARAELVAVASRDEGRARDYAARHGIDRAYGSYEALLADGEIDCVYISAPNSEHAPLSSSALSAGKHVLCEKPLAVSREEGEALFQHARECDRFLMEAFMYRHHDRTRLLCELVRSGELGQVQVITSTFNFRVDDSSVDIRYRPDLAGGALRDVGCYCVSLATHLAGGAPERVEATARVSSSGVDEVFGGLLSFADGSMCLFDCGMHADLRIGVTVAGSDGLARVATPWYPHLAPAKIEVWRGPEREVIGTSTANPYLLEVENFCAAVEGESAPEISADETLRNLGVMDELAAAARLPNYQLEAKGSRHR